MCLVMWTRLIIPYWVNEVFEDIHPQYSYVVLLYLITTEYYNPLSGYKEMAETSGL
jgi:hypothetical protein